METEIFLNEDNDHNESETEGKRKTLSLDEQETHIWMMRDENDVKVYSSDTVMIARLDKLCSKSPENWKCIQRDEISATYLCADKKLIPFRSHKRTRDLSEKQRQALAERLRNARRKSEESGGE